MEDQPVSPEQQEAYFQEQVAEGEKLASQGESGADRRAYVCARVTSADSSFSGPDLYVEAATHFYRALRVYPQPVELLMSELIERSSPSRSLRRFHTAP
jgi:import receptor subunit TOM20